MGIVGCGPSSTKVDNTKTQLKIAVYEGAGGTAWVETVADKFEEKYSTTSFEEGKTGVQIWVQPGKDQFTDEALLKGMPTGEYDIYFTQEISYAKAVGKKAFMDITDLLNEKYDEVDLGDGKKAYSILDKMNDKQVDYFGLSENGQTKYYALPYMSSIHGIIYDVDLFSERGFYFFNDGTLGASIDNEADELSVGPDGVANTFDDGLPATWEEMKTLITYMRDNEVTPFTWSGEYNYQRHNLFETIWASYEGVNDYELNYSMNGSTIIDGVETQITPENGWKLASQEGKLAALTAIRDIVSNSKNYSNQAFLGSQSHTGAQREYILSRYQDEPIAMLIEASYWENEATAYFSEMEKTYGEEWAQSSRRFGFLPIPKFIGTPGVPDQTNDEIVLNGKGYNMTFINAYTKKENVAKEFFKFVHTNEMLSLATGVNGIFRGLKCKLNDSDWDKMSYFQQQAFTMQHTLAVVNNSLPANKEFAYGAKTYMQYWDRTVKCDTAIYKDLFKDFADALKNGKPLDPVVLYNSYAQNINETTWGK